MSDEWSLVNPYQPLSLSVDHPSAARAYDYLLGGGHHFEIDRQFVKQNLLDAPYLKDMALANRRFLGRAVTYAVNHGIEQFVDIGSGLPTVNNVHEVADRERPGQTRVVYVDNDLIAHAHAEILLDTDADPRRHHALCADFYEYQSLWEDVAKSGKIDFDEPLCLLVVAVLHFMPPSSHPERVLRWYVDQLPSGSLLVMSHATHSPDGGMDAVAQRYARETPGGGHLRTKEEFTSLFDGLTLVEPGVVWVPEWHPELGHPSEGDPAKSYQYGGMGRKER